MPSRAPRRCTTPGCPRPAMPPHHKCPPCISLPSRPRPPSDWAFYNDPQWRALSAQIRREHPVCQADGCRRPSKHVDHIDGDRSNWSRANLRALCVPCHSRKTVTHDGGFGNPRAR